MAASRKHLALPAAGLPPGLSAVAERSMAETVSENSDYCQQIAHCLTSLPAKIDRDHISKLPWELKRMLTHYLDDVSATCLRLTCTSFYEACAGCLHRPSRSWCCNGDTIKPSCYTTSLPYRQLGEMLRSDGFFGELIYFNGGIKTGAMFVTEERLGEILKDEAAEVERH